MYGLIRKSDRKFSKVCDGSRSTGLCDEKTRLRGIQGLFVTLRSDTVIDEVAICRRQIPRCGNVGGERNSLRNAQSKGAVGESSILRFEEHSGGATSKRQRGWSDSCLGEALTGGSRAAVAG